MFVEAIDAHKRAIDRYCDLCRDSVSSSIAESLRDSLTAMGQLVVSYEDAEVRLRNSQEKGDDITRRKKAIMARLVRIVPSLQSGGYGSSSNSKLLVDRHHMMVKGCLNAASVMLRTEGAATTLRQEPIDKKEYVMNEKDKEFSKDFISAFHSMKEIECALEKADEGLSLMKIIRKHICVLEDASKHLNRVPVIDNAELRRIESRLLAATRVKEAATSSFSELDTKLRQLNRVDRDISNMRASFDPARSFLDQSYKFWRSWKGTSGRTKKLLRRVNMVLARCQVFDSKVNSIKSTVAGLLNEAQAIQRRCASKIEDNSRQLQRANENRQMRTSLIEDIRKIVNDISNKLGTLSGREARQFVSAQSIEDGRSILILSPDCNPENILDTAISAYRQTLLELSASCRMHQPTLDLLGKNDMNVTTVFPNHIVCAGIMTRMLGDELSIPYSLPFPFNKPLIFGEAKDVASLLIRLLYALPIGKLLIRAIDHKGVGENVEALNALCGPNGQLQIVTSIDDVTPLLRELDGLMGEMTRNMFNNENGRTWTAYNANHPEASLPLRIVPIFSMQGFSVTQLDLLQKLLVNGPRFGIIVIITDDAPNDLDTRLHDKFNEIDFDSDRIDKSGTRLGKYENLLLEISPVSISSQRIGELAELYAKEYFEINKKPMRELKFLSLLQGQEENIHLWGGASSYGLSAPIGWDLLGTTVNFEFGVGRSTSAYHALIGGTTGSGKSVFLHTLIQSLACRYSPEELQFYLLDYKKGDEFKKYATLEGNSWLPHVKMISRHKDPRFALELFDFLDKEFRRRSDQFGDYGDIIAYRTKGGGRIPRIVIIIDEFQVMFEEYCGLNLSDEVAKRISTVFKQGRSYGIHLVLATQSLASLHFSGMAGILGQIGLRIALKGMAQDGILAEGNRAAESLVPRRQCIVNPAFGLKDSEGIINNIITEVPWADPSQVDDSKKFRLMIEEKVRENNIESSCRVFNGAELPESPSPEVVAASLESENWKTFFTLLLGARTDFVSSPFAVAFTEEQREHLIVAGEGGNLSSDSEVHITGEDIWNGLRHGILRSLCSLDSCKVMYYNPDVGTVPQDVPVDFIGLSGRAKEKDLLEAFHQLKASDKKKKIVIVENFQEARLLHPADAPRASFSSRPVEPQTETARSVFASLFNGADDPMFHVILMTKNFSFMSKEVLARSGAETNILKGCAKRVAFNLSDDDLNVMIPHLKMSDRRGPRRVWFEDIRTGSVLDFLPYGGNSGGLNGLE